MHEWESGLLRFDLLLALLFLGLRLVRTVVEIFNYISQSQLACNLYLFSLIIEFLLTQPCVTSIHVDGLAHLLLYQLRGNSFVLVSFCLLNNAMYKLLDINVPICKLVKDIGLLCLAP